MLIDKWNSLLEKFQLPDWTKTLLDHNRWTVVGASTAVVFLLTVQGCDLVKVPSPVDGKPVTRTELSVQQDEWQTAFDAKVQALKLESATMTKRFQLAQNQMDEKLSALNTLLNMASGYIPDGPWKAAIPIALSFLSVGLKADNTRKDSVIAAKSVIPPVVAVTSTEVIKNSAPSV